MLGLEYGMLFGVPRNKIETWDGKSRWVFTFPSRDESEAHFHDWLTTLSRWKQADMPSVQKGSQPWRATAKDILIELYPRPIRFEVPIDWNAFEALIDTFWE